jgi:hypothetical protein
VVDHGRRFDVGFGGMPDRPQNPSPGESSSAETGDPRSLVRPYAVTGGRTRPRYELAIEALVSAAPYPPRDVSTLTPEYKAIINLCREWRSVAEVSALLRLPLGVSRILIADMAHEGLLRLHQTRATDGRPDVRLLERVLSGLRNL